MIVFIYVALYENQGSNGNQGSISKKSMLGIVIGSFVAVLIMVALSYWFVRSKRKGNQISYHYSVETNLNFHPSPISNSKRYEFSFYLSSFLILSLIQQKTIREKLTQYLTVSENCLIHKKITILL